MTKKLTWTAIAAASVGLGLSMPSCPGQQAMQEQVDAQAQKITKLEQTVQQMDGRLKNTERDTSESKALLNQITETIKAQTDALLGIKTTLEAQAAAAKAKAAAPAKAPAKAAPRRR